MKEEWRPIKGYEGLYEVSNMGRVKSLHASQEIILKQAECTNGYMEVKLSKDGTKNMKLVHRLVAIAFIKNPNNYECVNHKDGNKKNNTVGNLEWCTVKENTHHAIKTGLTNLTVAPKPVMVYKDGKLVGVFRPIRKCAEKLNCDRGNISGVIHGKFKTHHGFTFKLVNSDDLDCGHFSDLATKVVAIKDTQVIKAKSGYELAKKLGVLRGTVSSALKYGTKIKGFTVRKDE